MARKQAEQKQCGLRWNVARSLARFERVELMSV